jgi:hypothetical protein
MSYSEDPTQGLEHGTAAGEDPTGAGAADSTPDPTQGAPLAGRASEDPTQGVEVGEGAYEDPTLGEELGSVPGDDPMAPAT